MFKWQEKILENYDLTTLREMAVSLKEILRGLSNTRDIRDEHLLKLYFFREFHDYLNGWADSVYSATVRVQKDVKTNKYPKVKDLYRELFGCQEDSFREHIPAFISGFNNKKNPEYSKLPVIKTYDLDDIFYFCMEYYQWLSKVLSEKGEVKNEDVHDKIFSLYQDHPFSFQTD